MDLVELTASLYACSPKALLMACVSARSPSGVEVACALRYCTSPGLSAASRSALCMAQARTVAVFGRRGDVVRIAAHAEADQLGVDARAARLARARVLRAPWRRRHRRARSRRDPGPRGGWLPAAIVARRQRLGLAEAAEAACAWWPSRHRRRARCRRRRTGWCASPAQGVRRRGAGGDHAEIRALAVRSGSTGGRRSC